MLSYISSMSPVIIAVLVSLVFFSLVSWAIIIYKLIQIGAVRKNTKVFLDYFWETKEFSVINGELGRFVDCPLALLFKEGYHETEHFLFSSPGDDGAVSLRADMSAIENISRSLRKISTQEIGKLERNIGFLATTGSTTPFIGLFGTVGASWWPFRALAAQARLLWTSWLRASPRP